MNGNNTTSKMANAVKWSLLAEMAAKLVTPITSMLLARILAPESFGIVATISIITSLADMLADAGFQKYLIQHRFDSDEELYQYASTAFWINIAIAFILWSGIILLSKPISILIGVQGHELAVVAASSKLFITAFAGIQRALCQRSLNYKRLFCVRIVLALIPLVITIPFALAGFGYWALIIATLMNELAYAVILTIWSPWKPSLYFSFSQFKHMLSFSVWSIVEQLSIWLATYIDTFLVSHYLNEYYVGMYKQPYQIVTNIYSVFTGSIFTILFSALSRSNDTNDENGYMNILNKTQKALGMLIVPMGIGIFIYRDLVTNILLGSKWQEASLVVGVFALEKIIQLVFNNSASEIYRSKGQPKISLLAQVIFIMCLVPCCIFGLKGGFERFVVIRGSACLIFLIIHAIILHINWKISVASMFINIARSVFATLVMAVPAYFFEMYSQGNIVIQFVGIALSTAVYVSVLMCFSDTRVLVKQTLNKVRRK